MGPNNLHLYELLRERLGEQEAKDIATRVSADPRGGPETAQQLATKEDIAMLKADIANARIEILRWILFLLVTLIFAVLGLYV